MDSVTRTGCKLVLNEVYEGERADAFFSLMPTPDSERELSQHSQLYEAGPHDDTDENVKEPPPAPQICQRGR